MGYIFGFEYFVSILLLAGALASVVVENPVYAVFYLIFVFFQASLLVLLMGAEYLAFVLIMVYVGAIAVLFPFIAMLLNMRSLVFYEFNFKYVPSIFLIIGFLSFNIFLFLNGYIVYKPVNELIDVYNEQEHIFYFGFVVYENILFFVVILALFISMISTLYLLKSDKLSVSSENIYEQHVRTNVLSYRSSQK